MLLDRNDLAKKLCRSVRQLNRDRAAGLIPEPAIKPPRHPLWVETEIDAWINAGLPDAYTWQQIRKRSKR